MTDHHPLPTLTGEQPEWMDQALCAQVGGDAFFPEVGESPKDAKAICAECPVRAECLAYALAHNEKFGVWGGLTEAERRGRGRLCTDCGETISRRHTYCADCRARRKVDSTRRSYERRKRSRGAAA